jgi:hypothetical protein
MVASSGERTEMVQGLVVEPTGAAADGPRQARIFTRRRLRDL